MAIRNWSFTRFWAVTGAIWFVSVLAGEAFHYYYWSRVGRLLAFALACTPAFLAGAWAGTHPEIARWPRVRLATMWVLISAAIIGASDHLLNLGTAAAIIGAPAAILSLRWYELTAGRPEAPTLSSTAEPDPIVTPPPGKPRKQLPSG